MQTFHRKNAQNIPEEFVGDSSRSLLTVVHSLCKCPCDPRPPAFPPLCDALPLKGSRVSEWCLTNRTQPGGADIGDHLSTLHQSAVPFWLEPLLSLLDPRKQLTTLENPRDWGLQMNSLTEGSLQLRSRGAVNSVNNMNDLERRSFPRWDFSETADLTNTSIAALCDPKLRSQWSCAQTPNSKQLLLVLEDQFVSHGCCVDSDDLCWVALFFY